MNASTITKVLKKSIVLSVLTVTLCLITIAATRVYKNIEKESWVNSYYNELSLEERAGLLIWFEINCSKNIDEQIAFISSLSTAGVLIENCSCESTLAITDRLSKKPFVITAERENIHGLPSLLDPQVFGNNGDLNDQFEIILRNETELYGLDFYRNVERWDNLNLHDFTGNQRQLRKDILRNDGIIINNELKHIYYETINLIKSGVLSEDLLENKAKKILEVRYDRNDSNKKEDIINRRNHYRALLNDYNNSLINDHLDLSGLSKFSLEFKDRIAIVGDEQNAEILSSAFKTHIPSTHLYSSIEDLPKDPDSHFNKYIFINSDATENQFKSAGDLLHINTAVAEEYENSFYFPFDDPLSYERLLSKLLIPTPENSEILTYHNVPEDVGIKSSELSYIDSIVNYAIREEVFPGCQILVAHSGRVIMNKSFGFHSYDSILKVTNQSIFDLASVTKAASTTLAIMKLYEGGKIDIDRKASFYLDELKNTDKENLIIRDILAHQSGLRSYFPFWKRALSDKKVYLNNSFSDEFSMQISSQRYLNKITPDSLWSWIIQTPLAEKKDPRKPYDYKYSDIGFFFLKKVIEKVTAKTLDSFVEEEIYTPMGIYNLSYNPLGKFPASEIVPTEFDRHLRNSLLVGQVHDRNAALSGGVDGHAGLFGNSAELAKLLQMMINEGSYGEVNLYSSQTIETFTKKHYNGNRRGLGWDKSSNDTEDNTSDYASLSTFGHSGFTGTGFWADPENDLVYVFLSNRVYPDAENNKISELRVRENIQDVIYKSIMD